MNAIIVIGIVLMFLFVYKLFTFLIFLILKARLRNGNFDSFTRILGSKYQYRLTFNGLRRYKWSKLWFAVKANFDEKGNLICHKVEPQIIFKLKSELSFIN